MEMIKTPKRPDREKHFQVKTDRKTWAKFHAYCKEQNSNAQVQLHNFMIEKLKEVYGEDWRDR